MVENVLKTARAEILHGKISEVEGGDCLSLLGWKGRKFLSARCACSISGWDRLMMSKGCGKESDKDLVKVSSNLCRLR